VALGKMLRLGGMDNSAPKTDQSTGRFRVARNVLPTPDGRILPRNAQTNIPNIFPADTAYIQYMSQHLEENLAVICRDPVPGGASMYQELYKFDTVATRIPMQGTTMGIPNMRFSLADSSHSIMSYMKNNTTYFIDPTFPSTEKGNALKRAAYKYDGVEVSPMGCPQPKITSSDNLPAGTKYIRVIQHQLDFDNNEPVSEYFQFRTSAATNLNITTNTTTLIGGINVLPSSVINSGLSGITGTSKLSDTLYFRGSGTYNAVNNEYVITATDTNITQDCNVGAWVFISHTQESAIFNGLPEASLAIALRVKSISPLTLDNSLVKYLTLNKEWKDSISATGLAIQSYLNYGCRKFLSVWASNSEFGAYFFRGSGPAFPESSGPAHTFTVNIAAVNVAAYPNGQTAFTTPPILGDWYDTTTKKIAPTADYPFGEKLGITCYQDLLIMFTEELIWFSDPTLGGSFEQFNAASFILVGDAQEGKITSVCGTSDFLFVSRERKNYYLNGNLSTGNYRVQEISEAEIGCYSNNASISIKDSVFFMSCLGVYKLSSGGGCQLLSERIPQNFLSFDNYQNNTNSDVVFRPSVTNTAYPIFSGFGFEDFGLSVKFDEYRDMLVFCFKGLRPYGEEIFSYSPCLVLHTKTGEFYEWDYIVDETGERFRTSAIHFRNGQLYVGEVVIVEGEPPQYVVKFSKEDKDKTHVGLSQKGIKLYSSWMTAGEPSLEKQALQVKLFGQITPEDATKSITVVHFKDWNNSTKITSQQYVPLNSTIHYHKKRLNSDKVLAISVGIECRNLTRFQIEGMEVEFNPIQEGMKK
jgi:hypothetical protein